MYTYIEQVLQCRTNQRRFYCTQADRQKEKKYVRSRRSVDGQFLLPYDVDGVYCVIGVLILY